MGPKEDAEYLNARESDLTRQITSLDVLLQELERERDKRIILAVSEARRLLQVNLDCLGYVWWRDKINRGKLKDQKS